MVLTDGTAGRQSYSGIRPINLSRDVPGIVKLLNLVFSPTLDAEGRRALNSLSNKPYVITRFAQLAGGISPGFVWVEDGRIVGNVSLMPTKTAGRVIVANVAVEPEYRQRGIARRLMEACLEHLSGQRVNTVILQVDYDNAVAGGLYDRLGFVSQGSTTLWTASFASFRDVETNDAPYIRPIRGSEYALAYQIDCDSFAPTLAWPDPLPPNTYRKGLLTWWDNFINGRQVETWTIPDTSDRPLAIGSIWSEWGRAHRLTVRVPEEWRATLTQPLFAKLLRRLRYLRRRTIHIEHLAGDDALEPLLHLAQFRPKRTLTTMHLDLSH